MNSEDDPRYAGCETGEDIHRRCCQLDAVMRYDLNAAEIKYEAWGVAQFILAGLPPRQAAREFYEYGTSRLSLLKP